ncbi:MAG: Gfo/Idh/MocA family oxidoreductase [Pseudomonadota bacterium]
MTPPHRPRIAVLGAGLVGRRHAALLHASGQLHAIIDPDPLSQPLAADCGVPHFTRLDACLRADRPDGLINATPNQLHRETTECALRAGVPTLVEKPIASTTEDAAAMVAASDATGVPLLVGHHRRHNPLIEQAKALIDAGSLGEIQVVHAQCWLYKPDDYFDAAWRRDSGAGPVFINLIHDVDLLRHLCGEVVDVHALHSRHGRGFDVEETAGALLRFANGALATLSVTDTVPAPWSWELSARENPAYPATDGFCYLIGGKSGSLSLPDLNHWHYGEQPPSWWAPIQRTRYPIAFDEPLQRQIAHFSRVIRGDEAPLVSGREGLETLRVIERIKAAAAANEQQAPTNSQH